MKKVGLIVFIYFSVSSCSEKIMQEISDKGKKDRSILLFQQIEQNADSQITQYQPEVKDSLQQLNLTYSDKSIDSSNSASLKRDSIYSIPLKKKYLMTFSEDEQNGEKRNSNNSKNGWGILVAIGIIGVSILFPFVLILGFAESLTFGVLLLLGGLLLIGLLGSYFVSS